MRFCEKAGIACSAVMRRRKVRLIRRICCFVLMLAFSVSTSGSMDKAEASSKKPVIQAGYRVLSSSLPAERLMLRMGVWYPARRHPGVVKADGWTFRAARNAPVMEGAWPVIMLSHDVTGDAWSHHQLAAALARRGFIVASPTHDYDNAEDMRLLFSDRELPLRALQIRAALDLVLENDHIGPKADRGRVGFLGFGLTAPSGLLLAGGSLSSEGWAAFVQERNAASGKDALHGARPSIWLQPYLAKRMDQLVDKMEHRAEERRQKTAMMQSALVSRQQTFQKIESALERSHQRLLRQMNGKDLPPPPAVLPLLPPLSHDRAVADERFKALALVSPGFSMLFSWESLAPVHRPVLLVGAGQDKLLIPDEQAERLAAMLPSRADYRLFLEADTSVFHSIKPDGVSHMLFGQSVEEQDPTRRLLLQEQLLNTLQDFFTRAFDVQAAER